MNIRFFNAKILQPDSGHSFRMTEGELWVEGDRISCAGRPEEAESSGHNRQPVWDREVDASGCLLMPGFKNAHTHTAMTFLRSYADDLPLQEWLEKQVFPKEALLTEEDAYWLDILGIMEYLTSGITSNADMYFLPMASARAARDTGFRTVQVGALNNFVSSPGQMEEEYYAITEMGSRLGYMAGIHAEYTTSLQLMEEAAQLAQKLRLPFYMHNAETKREVEECIRRYGKTPTALTESLGAYAYGGGGYHCIWMTEEDMQIFADRGLYAVTCPASNLKLASGIAPVKAFVDRKIGVAVGTDGPASNNCLDMFREIFLTVGLAKVREMDAACIPAQEVLYMAVTGGALAMGLPMCGALVPGNKADLILLDLNQPNMQPENNLVKNIVYSANRQNVKLTMVDGRILYEDGKFDIGFDPKEIYAKANGTIRRM